MSGRPLGTVKLESRLFPSPREPNACKPAGRLKLANLFPLRFNSAKFTRSPGRAMFVSWQDCSSSLVRPFNPFGKEQVPRGLKPRLTASRFVSPDGKDRLARLLDSRARETRLTAASNPCRLAMS